MPKIIPGLQETLLEKAMELFSDRGYLRTELRDVAAAAGCSVGNIYNYYKSKPHLLLAVSGKWREKLGVKISQILASSDSPEGRIEQVCLAVYHQVDSVQGLWKEFFLEAPKALRDPEIQKLMCTLDEEERRLLIAVERVMVEADPQLIAGGPPGDGRWASMLIASVFQLPRKYPGEEEENRRFIRDLIRRLLRRDR